MDAQTGILSYYLCDNSSSPSSGSGTSFSNAIGTGEEPTAVSSNISGTPRWQVRASERPEQFIGPPKGEILFFLNT